MPNARDVARDVLSRVELDRAYAAAALASALAGVRDPREAAFATELVLGVLRRRSFLDNLLESVSNRGLKKISPHVRQILRIGVYQIVFLERIPNHAVVSEAVEQTRRSKASSFSGLVNAMLRRITEMDPESLMPNSEDTSGSTEDLGLRLGLPTWLIRRLIGAHSKNRAVAIANTYNQPSRRTLRVNINRSSREHILKTLDGAGSLGHLSPWSIDVTNPTAALKPIEDGLAVYQDEGAQLVALALAPMPGERILDACAGRGGKTGTLAMMVDGKSEIVASDRGSSKLERLRFELDRQGFKATPVVADLTQASQSRLLGAAFHRILLDAPCSGTGTMGRRPEIRWRLDRGVIRSLVQIQSKLLDATAELLAPGGRLVYAVCSVLPEEGSGQITAFLERHKDFGFVTDPPPAWPKKIPWKNGSVFIDPSISHTDGYQIVSLVRK
jgi:16S rRNA (cytosine967-C5)-methyltransferase